MRISDWCSNVCSSDLQPDDARKGVDDDQLAVLRPRDQQPAVVGAEIDRTIALRSRERGGAGRSEEHTSELQSLMRTSYDVFCLKKKYTMSYRTKQYTRHTVTEQYKKCH